MSNFIENSKHAGMTAAVTDHFFNSGKPDTTGMSSASAKGYNGQNSLPNPPKNPPFGHPNTGVNYRPKAWAGSSASDTEPYGR